MSFFGQEGFGPPVKNEDDASRSRERALESTFDYEEYASEYDQEERELTSKLAELRQQNNLLQNMCSLVLQKSCAAHQESQALLHLLEMLNAQHSDAPGLQGLHSPGAGEPLMKLEDTPYSNADTRDLEAVAAAALATNEDHVAGAIIDLLLMGARRRSAPAT
ncbi:hypothetical protein WJX73_007517 [Symbiochloris irregularis]|uniref:Uncharacterized protein n=1 Tax=Symbiochloris irregularis TaxID=706552 RepID=A0AAW1PFX6_9CHLO